ncbi:MAG: sugar phosphate isomerase/epimerase [Lachnospiraceae bacterium]|nr:sugar phosphate isomerase/epimerase [Lachnospiraceae bacterium]
MGKLYCIPSLRELDSYLGFAERYNAGFEYNDFFIPELLDDGTALDKIIKHYMSVRHDRGSDTMHGAFLDICVNSADSRIFEASDYRVRQCMDIAVKMGLKAVIFHTNYIVNFKLRTYLDSWIDRNEEYWRQILKDYQEQQVYIENMFDDAPGMLKSLAERMADEPRFGVCLDVAHACISGSPVESWYDIISPYVKHIHINDNDGVEDLHNPVGTGIMEWDKFSRWCSGLGKEPSVLVETRGYRHLEESVEYMQKNRIYPFI